MGIQKHELEVTSHVPAEKIFQGLVVDVDTILPKAAPGAYKSVDIKGDGGAGTIKHITLPDGSPVSTMTLRTDALDKHALTLDYTVTDGDILLGFIEKIENHLVVVPTPDGGSKTKTTARGGATAKAVVGCSPSPVQIKILAPPLTTATFHTKGDAVVPEENIKYADEQNTALFRAVEAYLIAN